MSEKWEVFVLLDSRIWETLDLPLVLALRFSGRWSCRWGGGITYCPNIQPLVWNTGHFWGLRTLINVSNDSIPYLIFVKRKPSGRGKGWRGHTLGEEEVGEWRLKIVAATLPLTVYLWWGTWAESPRRDWVLSGSSCPKSGWLSFIWRTKTPWHSVDVVFHLVDRQQWEHLISTLLCHFFRCS